MQATHLYFATTQCILQAACRREINECYNGGTMIWDPAKTFSCICKEGYKGELCKTEDKNVIYKLCVLTTRQTLSLS